MMSLFCWDMWVLNSWFRIINKCLYNKVVKADFSLFHIAVKFLKVFAAHSSRGPGTLVVNVDHHMAFLGVQLERTAVQTLIMDVKCLEHRQVIPKWELFCIRPSRRCFELFVVGSPRLLAIITHNFNFRMIAIFLL